MPTGVAVLVEAIATLRRRLASLPARHPERKLQMASYGVSRATLYRLLRGERRPKDAQRADRDRPRSMPAAERREIQAWFQRTLFETAGETKRTQVETAAHVLGETDARSWIALSFHLRH